MSSVDIILQHLETIDTQFKVLNSDNCDYFVKNNILSIAFYFHKKCDYKLLQEDIYLLSTVDNLFDNFKWSIIMN